MDKNAFIWEIYDSPYPSQFLSGTRKFGESFPLYLVDQFHGKRPMLINNDFLRQGKINFYMYPSAILDSNILSAINRRVSENVKLDGLEDFLKFLIIHKWDFSPMFYIFESFSKSLPSNFFRYAIKCGESLLRLQSMDEKHFLKTGEIIPDEDMVVHYIEEGGVKTLFELAERKVMSFVREYNPNGLAPMIEVTQIALIKMVLIHKYQHPKWSVARKYEEFITFLRNELGTMLAREAGLSLYYFCGQAGRLLGIESTQSFEDALNVIRATAWDIFLLRLPEKFISNTHEEICFPYIATQEKKLHEFAKLFITESIYCVGSNIFPNVFLIDLFYQKQWLMKFQTYRHLH
jgi:hypothetical protein